MPHTVLSRTVRHTTERRFSMWEKQSCNEKWKRQLNVRCTCTRCDISANGKSSTIKTKRRKESENWNETIELAWLLSANNESFYFPWYRRFQMPHEARSTRCITVLTKRKMSINLMTQIMYYYLLHVKRNDNTKFRFRLSHFSVVVDVVQWFSSTNLQTVSNWHHKRRNTKRRIQFALNSH